MRTLTNWACSCQTLLLFTMLLPSEDWRNMEPSCDFRCRRSTSSSASRLDCAKAILVRWRDGSFSAWCIWMARWPSLSRMEYPTSVDSLVTGLFPLRWPIARELIASFGLVPHGTCNALATRICPTRWSPRAAISPPGRRASAKELSICGWCK